jgi:rhamnulokinase
MAAGGGECYVAVDIGASGGRLFVGAGGGPEAEMEEVYRFANAAAEEAGALVWKTEALFGGIVEGLTACAARGFVPASIAVDTWGVDYVLLDRQGREIMPVYAYRDSRTLPFMRTRVPFAERYAITGTADNPFNTVYQLLADQAAGRLERAEAMLFLPEYFAYRLSGERPECCEYTLASTSGLLDAVKQDWAWGLIERLGLPARLFRPIRMPPYPAGNLRAELRAGLGFDARIVMAAGHDTASAVSAVPEDALYISSGTWSLLGIQGGPILTEEARLAGYTNEGGAGGRIRFLKNITGLWMMQRARAELGGRHSYKDLEELAQAAAPDQGVIDVNQACFLNPASMLEAVAGECRRAGLRKPETAGDYARRIYEGLAESYRRAVADLERIAGAAYPLIRVIGGGSRDRCLNALTERALGKPVYTGPAEAAAAGSLAAQRALAERARGRTQ